MDDFLGTIKAHNPDFPSSPLQALAEAQQLSTHPEKQPAQKTLADLYVMKVRYKMFDLSNSEDVEALEETVTEILTSDNILRDEKWTSDKEGLTTVTVSWIECTPRVVKKDEQKETALPDGAHPGAGMTDADVARLAIQTPGDLELLVKDDEDSEQKEGADSEE